MTPRKNKAAELSALKSDTVSTDTKSSGAPSTEGNAADVSTLDAGGSPASQPGDMGQSPGTNTSEESATVEAQAGNEAGLATVVGMDFGQDEGTVLWFAPPAEAYETHPLLAAFVEEAKGLPVTGIRVTCATEGFRRGGQRHPAGETDYLLDHFTADQLEQLLGDKTFTVELV